MSFIANQFICKINSAQNISTCMTKNSIVIFTLLEFEIDNSSSELFKKMILVKLIGVGSAR